MNIFKHLQQVGKDIEHDVEAFGDEIEKALKKATERVTKGLEQVKTLIEKEFGFLEQQLMEQAAKAVLSQVRRRHQRAAHAGDAGDRVGQRAVDHQRRRRGVQERRRVRRACRFHEPDDDHHAAGVRRLQRVHDADALFGR